MKVMDSEEHHALVNVIQEIHDDLRKSLFLTGDPNKVWKEHLRQKSTRKKYSKAMLKLATEVWGEKECRIEWSYKTCIDYFMHGGLERSLLRAEKRRMLSMTDQKNFKKVLSFTYEINNNFKCKQKLTLLDIGSCFNPFNKYPEFCCVAIDLTPATEDVLECDFLSVKVLKKGSKEVVNSSTLMFYEESYDIVVISLVLGYLPAGEQRAIFCFKAWQLLQENGLCIIIMPDSKSVHHNAPMMKSWKKALEKIGFIRTKYEKLTHIHCMAFRKSSKYSVVDLTNCKNLAPLLYTPQDFKSYEKDDTTIHRSEEEDCKIYNQFLELPDERFLVD